MAEKLENDGYKYDTYGESYKPTSVYITPPQMVLAKAGLEVCKTDEENWEPYVSTSNSESNEETEEEKHKNESGTTSEDTGYDLLQGQITDIRYLPQLQTADFEQDYLDMNSSGTVKLFQAPTDWCYKGVPVALRRGWEENGTNMKWEDMDKVLDGFITEQTYTEEGTELKISGRSKLLERTYKFKFSQMNRSVIIEEVIKCAGLVPMVNATGLEDDIIDFNNLSGGKGSSSSGTTEGESTGDSDIDEAVDKAVGDETQPLAKAQAIDKAFKNRIIYKLYWNVSYPNISDAWKVKWLNCADGANVLCAMFRKAGLDAVIVHTPKHYIVKLKINGKTYYTDNAASTGSHTTRPFGEVWRGITSGEEVGTKISA